MYIIDTVHLVGIKKVFDAIKNEKKKKKKRKLSNTIWDNQYSCCDLHQTPAEYN
jgi:hypothetical protein